MVSMDAAQSKTELDIIAIRIDSNLAEAYYNRGIARSKSGNKQAAIQDLSKAGELGLYDAYAVIKRLNKQK